MTYDERQEIVQYLDIVKKNANRLLHSIELLEDALDKAKCEIKKEPESAKGNFLKHY